MRGACLPSIRWFPLHTASLPPPPNDWARADEALAAYRAVALLDDTDPAGVHYQLAKLLRDAGKPQEARREVLRSLEEAPRFREAHQLLLELVDQQPARQFLPAEFSPEERPR